MDEQIQTEIHALLDNFWILKEDNIELYYSIKRHQAEIRSFIVKNLGSRLIVHEKFIKLEKLPTVPSANLGLKTFTNKSDYVYLCLVLLFLEDKPQGTYFMLANLIDFVKSTTITMELDTIPDWKLPRDRKSLKKAVDYLIKLGAIRLKDESERDFSNDEFANALYEATGISNYVMRVFNNEIFDYTKENDFIKDEWLYQDEDKGDIRKYKIYRNLLFTPAVFSIDISESEIDYVKKLRGHMKDELMNNLGYELEVTRNMAVVFDYEEKNFKELFPNNKRICAICLIVNRRLQEKISNGEIPLDEFEVATIEEKKFYEIVDDVRTKHQVYLSSELKIKSPEVFFQEIKDYMIKYSFIRETKSGYFRIYPSVRIFESQLLESKDVQMELLNEEV